MRSSIAFAEELDIDVASHLIDGTWDASGTDDVEVIAPRDLERIGVITQAGPDQVDAAVAAARRAFPAWRDTSARARGRILLRIADELEASADRLARILALENGNALRTQSRGEIAYAIEVFRYFGTGADSVKGEQIPLAANRLDYSRHEPYGVVASIIPWNAPVQLGAMKIAPALATGNTLVLKTAEDAPFAVLEMARIVSRHLPPGVLNVLHGTGAVTGEALIGHDDIDKISFTGSTGVGARILQSAASRILPVSLELGGKNPQIVFPDADDDWAVDAALLGMRFTRQSQSCTAGSRLFVHRAIFDSFVEKFAAKAGALTIGDPLDETSDIGAIVNARQYARVCGFVEEGLAISGARAVTGGSPVDEDLEGGLFVRPTVFTGIDESYRINREEIFGPVAVAIPWEDEDEVVAMANDSHYGLSAFIYSRDIGAAIRTAHRVDAGWVQVNQGGAQVLGQSYGGYKRSGMGREFSVEGMVEGYTQRKHVSINIEI